MNLSAKPVRTFDANTHPAEKFAGFYQLMEVDDSGSEFKPGDLDKYEKCENYEIVVYKNQEENGIRFKPLGKPFKCTETLFYVNDQYIEYTNVFSNDHVISCGVLLVNDKLIIEEVQKCAGVLRAHRVRVHELEVEDEDEVYLLVSDRSRTYKPGSKITTAETRDVHKRYVKERAPN